MADKTVINSTGFFSGKKKTLIRNSSGEGLEKFKYGDIIDGRYEVTGEIGLDSGEADIYTVKDLKTPDAALRVIKIYRRKDAVKEEVLLKLMNIDNPSVARILDRGEVSGFTYLVLPYYSRGSLASYIEQGITFTVEELKNLVIPSVAEGLKALHDAGILHKDLKPGNMMIADDDRHIVLIDFGISSVTAGATMVVTSTGKSPFYAAPETATGLFWSGSDYYSLGISLYELYSGVTPYQNAGVDDVARYAQAERIPYPDDFDAELKELIDGLTYKDISFRNEPDNPNRRWGYEETRKWLDGVHQQVPGEGVTVKEPDAGDFPYYFNGSNYYSLKDFTEALLSSWEEGKKELFRGFLSRNFELRDDRLSMDLCLRAESTFEANPQDGDVIFWKLMYSLSPEISGIYWQNLHFSSLKDVAVSLCDEMNRNMDASGTDDDLTDYGYSSLDSEEDASGPEAASGSSGTGEKEEIISGFIRFFITERPYDFLSKNNTMSPEIISVTDIFNRRITENKLDFCTRIIWLYARAVSGRRDFQVDGRNFRDYDDFFRYVIGLMDADIMTYFDFCRKNRRKLRLINSYLNFAKSSDFLKNIPTIYSDDNHSDGNNINTHCADKEQKTESALSFDCFIFRNIEESLKFYEKYSEKVTGHHSTKEMDGLMMEIVTAPSVKEKALKKEFYDFRHRFRNALRNTELTGEMQQEIERRTGFKLFSPVKGNVEIGRTVLFGRYPQTGDGEVLPVSWLVLDVDAVNDRVLLLSESVLDFRQYYYSCSYPRWHYSSIRKWLNRDFLQTAFFEEEKKIIQPNLIADISSSLEYEAQYAEDFVFLLKKTDVNYYIKDKKNIMCMPTAYAERNSENSMDDNKECSWWLHDTDVYSGQAQCVSPAGLFYESCCDFVQGVRPAVWVNI